MSRKDRTKIKARNARKQQVIEKELETVEQAEEVINDQLAGESEELTKDYYDSYPPMLGPTSFEELDAVREAEERAHEVRMATYDVQDLVRNILYEPAEPKSQATKIKKVAAEFESRVGKIMAEPIKKDIEVLQIEAILATEARGMNLFQKGVEFVKEKLSSEARGNLSDSDFALPSKRKYPIHDRCLHGDVEIALLDGTSKPIKDLVGQEVWVYAFDEIQKSVVPALAKNIRKTVSDEQMLIVHLDSGESAVCTTDHRFLLRDGSYREAENLRTGDSIMPLYRKHVLLRGWKPYEQVYQPWYRFWEWTHHMAHREYYKVPLQDGNVIHHEDDNHFNNCPPNLDQMSRSAHCALHGEKNNWVHLGRLHEGSRKRWKREGEREKQSEVMRRENGSRKLDGRMSIIGKKISDSKLGPLAVDDSLVEEIYGKYINGASYTDLEKEYDVSRPTMQKHFSRLGLPTKREISRLNNHKVVLVEEFGQADGYDMEVPHFHNFALSSGVFVHNSHVRNALARAAQQIESGDEEAKADARAALPKIRAAAKKFGIEVSKEKSALIIEKDKSGIWRWVGKPTNNFIDWQGDILSKSAHQKYVSWLDKNPELAPVFVSWHTPGTRRASKVDFWMEQDGAVIMSGPLTEQEAGRLFAIQKSVDLGMSLQAFGLRLGSDPRVVTDYWCYEVSDLPRDAAANPFTMLETMTKEVGMDKLEYLTQIMGSKEEADAFLKKTSQAQAELAKAGIESKEKKEEKVEEKTDEQAPAAPNLDTILKAVSDHFKMDDLNAFVAQAQDNAEKVEVLEGLVKDLKTSKEDDLAAALTPPISKWNWAQGARASASPDTRLKKDKTEAKAEDEENLEKSAPGVPPGYWLSEVTGTVPIEAPAK